VQICLYKLVYNFKGTKIDLREDKEALQALAESGQSPIKREQGQKLSNKIRAVKYLECSALTQRGLKQVICLVFKYLKIRLISLCLIMYFLIITCKNYYHFHIGI
jgi:hypothetical protein